jgi:penicillin-binding protein 2
MHDVVNEPYGTGKQAGLSYTTLCGKTGTAQWGLTSKNQRLAWFAGFLPFDNPRYAFAVLYEGKPGEKVSGGGMAAPMVSAFFEPLKDDIKDIIAPPKRALVVVDEDAGATEEPTVNPDGTIKEPENKVPLRAMPVTPDDDVDDTELEQPLKALPVEEEEAPRINNGRPPNR